MLPLPRLNEKLLCKRCSGMLAIGRLPPASWILAWPHCTASSKSTTLLEAPSPRGRGDMATSEKAPMSSRLVNNACFGTLQGRLRTDSGRELTTHVTEDLGIHRVGFLHHNWPPGITATADFGVERQRPQKRHVIRLSGSLRPTMVENVSPGLTVGTEKIAHVFDEAQNR